jgi:hypothetical protein
VAYVAYVVSQTELFRFGDRSRFLGFISHGGTVSTERGFGGRSTVWVEGFIWNHKRRKNHKNENGYTARRAEAAVALLLELK